jgi:O-antigen ligase
MTAVPLPSRTASAAGPIVAGALALGLLAAGMAQALQSGGPPLSLAIAGGIALIGMLLLTIGYYDVAVGVGFLLMGVVQFEPAPPDGAFAVIMAVAAVTGRFRVSRAPLLVTGLLGALVAVNVLSMMDALDTGRALRYFGITLYLVLFSLWLVGYVDSQRRARVVVRAWLIIAVASAIASVIAFTLPVPFAVKDLLMGYDATRPRGLFKDPNVFGPFLIPIAVILLEQRLHPRVLRLRGSVALALFAVLAIGVVFSFGRAAWANLAIATLVMLAAASARQRGGRQAMRLLVSIVVVGAVVVGFVTVSGSVTFLEDRAAVQSYDKDRFSAQHLGYELGWSHPMGVGPGQFLLHNPVDTHSTYIRLIAEQGWGGLALWVGLVLTTLILALRNVVLGRDSYGVGAAALLGAWCGLIFNSAVVDTLHWRHLWIVAALIWVGAASQRAVSASRPDSRIPA